MSHYSTQHCSFCTSLWDGKMLTWNLFGPENADNIDKGGVHGWCWLSWGFRLKNNSWGQCKSINEGYVEGNLDSCHLRTFPSTETRCWYEHTCDFFYAFEIHYKRCCADFCRDNSNSSVTDFYPHASSFTIKSYIAKFQLLGSIHRKLMWL